MKYILLQISSNMNPNQQVELRVVDETDLEFLYKLLEKRDPIANISHKKMPSYEEHVQFVLSKPYSVWYVIIANYERVGSIYLSKQDEIGILLTSDMTGKGVGKIAIGILMTKNPRTRYLANINPKNKKSMEFFEKNGFRLIQYTYEIMKQDSNLSKE